MTGKTLAIIGGGASATLLLAQLARRRAPFAIDVYDRAGAFARGVAYSTTHACHLLNVRAANMSALADVPDDFARWAAQHGYAADAFVPRMRYGDYLTVQLERAQAALKLNLIQMDARSIKAEHGYRVNGKQYDLVVQATGNSVPLHPAGARAMAGYDDTPWDADYPRLSAHRRIAVLGSGLTAVDAVLALQAHGYAGHIVMLSRHAQLPHVHVQAAPYLGFGHDAWPTSVRAALRRFRHELSATDAPGQAVIDALRPLTNTIWQSWPAQEQQRFMRHLFSRWNTHRHRMAPQIGQTIAALERSGRLIRRRARIERILEGAVVVTQQGHIKADAVINCLGYRAFDPAAPPMAASHQIGPPLFGALFETTAIPEIRTQAAALAATLWP